MLVLGLTFKENCPDLRNTRVVDVIDELREYNVGVDVHDPWASPEAAEAEYGISLTAAPEAGSYDAVSHRRGPQRIPRHGHRGHPRPGQGRTRAVRPEIPIPGRADGPEIMNVLVTGNAGFVGFHTAKRLLERGDSVVGFDCVNDYYDPTLKEARLQELEATAAKTGSAYTFIRANLADRAAVEACFSEHRFDRVIHLAAQAGVRYSIENPHSYVESNIVAFTNILEACRPRAGTAPDLRQHQQRLRRQYQNAL